MSISDHADAGKYHSATPDGPAPLLINARAVRKIVPFGKNTLWQLTACDAIPSYRIGRSVWYSPAEIEAWVRCGCPTTPGSAARVRKAVAR
jgi:predicted DNA-binding transcriptional regulator AlpA